MKLTWTKTDEAPALASYALLPILRAYFKGTGVEIGNSRHLCSPAAIISAFRSVSGKTKKIPDELARLGELAKTPEANIVKLPNISASIPQLRDAARLRNFRRRVTTFPIIPMLLLQSMSVRCRPGLAGSWARP